MQACVDLRDDIQHKFDRLHAFLLRDILIIMGDIQPIRDLINELVDDLGDLLPVTSASALVDVVHLAEKKEKYLRVEEHRRRRNARGPGLIELSFVVDRLKGTWKAFEGTLEPKRLAQREVEAADREVADARKRLADAENRVALARKKLQRVTNVRARHRTEGEALYRRCEELRSAIPKVEGDPEADEDFIHRVQTTVAKALAVVVGANSRQSLP